MNQQKHFLFRWQWVDAWINSADGAYCKDSYGSLPEAQDNLCYFDGSKAKEEEVYPVATVKVINSDTNVDGLLSRLHCTQLVVVLRAARLRLPVTQQEAENVEKICKDAADKIEYLLETNDD